MASTCGGYEIKSTLGFGGNAVVKLVEKNGTDYAMKIFEPHPTERDEIIRKTQEEMAVVQNLNIDAIPKYHEFCESAEWIKKDGSSRDVSYLVMENCQGVELIEFLNQSKRQDDIFVRYIFHQIATALHQLHRAGIAHRDIKPENIILTENFDVKLIDLGYGISLSGRNQDGFNKTTLGTPMYMSPEIVDKQPYQGSDADLFAFGVTLMVARLVAYPFNEASLRDDKYKLLQGADAHLFWKQYKKSVPGLTDEFTQLITSMLQHHPASRPTMADVLGSQWMRGDAVDRDQFVAHCSEFMEKAKQDRLAEQEATGVDYSIPQSRARRGGPDDEDTFKFDAEFLMKRKFRPVVEQAAGQKSTQFLVNSNALNIMPILYEIIKEKDGQVVVSDDYWKFKFTGNIMEEPLPEDEEIKAVLAEESKEEQADQKVEAKIVASAQISVELHEKKQGEQYVVSFKRKGGSNIAFTKMYDDLHDCFIKTVNKEMADMD